MFCPNCGTQNSETASTCTKCGFNLKGAAAPKFKGTMLMNQAPGAPPPGQPPAGAPAWGQPQQPQQPPQGMPPVAPMNQGLAGTVVGVAPAGLGMSPGALPAPPPPGPPGPGGYGAPPQPAYGGAAGGPGGYAPPGQPQAGVNPLGGTMAIDQMPGFQQPGGQPGYGAPPAGFPAPQGAPPGGGFGAQPPGGGYGAPPGGQPGYGAPPPDQGGYGAPPGGQQPAYGAPPGGYGGPPAGPQPGYGAPPQDQGGFGQQPPQGGYGAPPGGQPGYGAPPQDQGGFGQQQQPGYGAPPGGQPGYGAPPQNQGGFGQPGMGMGDMSGALAVSNPMAPMTAGAKPTVRNPMMVLLIPFGIIFAGVIISIILGFISGMLAPLGSLVSLAGVVYLLIQVIGMLRELGNYTQDPEFNWWWIFIPCLGIYFALIKVPEQVTKAKQKAGIEQMKPTRPILLYILISPFALASDLNDIAQS